MRDDVGMNGRSALPSNEPMNQANQYAHQLIAIDLVKMLMTLLKLESGFDCKKEIAWGNNWKLGKVMKDINLHDYIVSKVKKMMASSQWMTMQFLFEKVMGSRIGMGTCSAPKVM